MNIHYYNAALALINAVPFIRHVDNDFAEYLLDKAQGYKDKIKIDKELESEVLEIKKEIEEGL